MGILAAWIRKLPSLEAFLPGSAGPALAAKAYRSLCLDNSNLDSSNIPSLLPGITIARSLDQSSCAADQEVMRTDAMLERKGLSCNDA